MEPVSEVKKPRGRPKGVFKENRKTDDPEYFREYYKNNKKENPDKKPNGRPKGVFKENRKTDNPDYFKEYYKSKKVEIKCECGIMVNKNCLESHKNTIKHKYHLLRIKTLD